MNIHDAINSGCGAPLPITQEADPQEDGHIAAPSQLYYDVREYATLVSQEAGARTALQNIEAALVKVKSRLAQTVDAGGTRYLRAGNSGIVKITHVMDQGEKIALIAVEDIE